MNNNVYFKTKYAAYESNVGTALLANEWLSSSGSEFSGEIFVFCCCFLSIQLLFVVTCFVYFAYFFSFIM